MDIFDFPPTVDDLADVPVEFQPAYRPTEGGFELARAVRRAQAKARKEIGETLAAKDARIAELEAQERANRERNRKFAIEREVDAVLKVARVKSGLHRAAKLALAGDDGLKFVVDEVDGDLRVEVETPHGRASVAAAIQSWLSSESGAGFNPPPVVKPERKYSAAMASLRALLR